MIPVSRFLCQRVLEPRLGLLACVIAGFSGGGVAGWASRRGVVRGVVGSVGWWGGGGVWWGGGGVGGWGGGGVGGGGGGEG